MASISNLEKEILAIKTRNKKVEIDKKIWERYLYKKQKNLTLSVAILKKIVYNILITGYG